LLAPEQSGDSLSKLLFRPGSLQSLLAAEIGQLTPQPVPRRKFPGMKRGAQSRTSCFESSTPGG